MTPTPTPPGRCYTCGAALLPLEHVSRSIGHCPNNKCPAHGRLVETKREPEAAKP